MRHETIHPVETRAAALRRARSCYDHLAGRLGVAVLAGLVQQQALVPADAEPYRLGPMAAPVFRRLGVDLAALLMRPASSRPLLRFCVDGTERRHHLAGALGAAVLKQAEAAHWVTRRPGIRALNVTDAGRQVFRDVLGVGPPASEADAQHLIRQPVVNEGILGWMPQGTDTTWQN